MKAKLLKKIRARFTVKPPVSLPGEHRWTVFDHRLERVTYECDLEDVVDFLINETTGICTSIDWARRRNRREEKAYYNKMKNL